jgi:hypothetical protein
MRIMGKDGRPQEPQFDPKKGLLDLTSVVSFQTHDAADKAARSAGWHAVEGNHRCPDCHAGAKKTARKGMYIDIRQRYADGSIAFAGGNA